MHLLLMRDEREPDVAWVTLDRTVRDAERFKLPAPLERWRQLRDHMHATICEQGFDSRRNTFTQSFGSGELDASLLLMPIMGFLPPDDSRVRGTLVPRPINSLTYFSDFLEDRIAGGSPYERGASGVIGIDEGLDLGDEVFGADE
jgi:Glycosyl hydrolases family 15